VRVSVRLSVCICVSVSVCVPVIWAHSYAGLSACASIFLRTYVPVHLCVFAYASVCLCACVSMCPSVCDLYLSIFVYVHLRVCACDVCVSVFLCVRLRMCAPVCMCTLVHVYLCVCVSV